MRITFVIPDLQCGGMQKAAVTVAEELARRGHVLTVLTMGREAEFFSVAAPVSLVRLGLKAERPTSPALLPFTALRRLAILRRAIVATSADVVVTHAAQVNVPTLLALIGIRTPVVVVEHGDVSKAAWYRARRFCYVRASRVVSVTEAVDRNVAWLPALRRIVIPNPIACPPPDAVADASSPPHAHAHGEFLASMGRLSHAKGFDLLIQAFARVAPDFPGWKLLIIGDGELRGALEQQAAALGLAERICFCGALPHPFALLRRAQLFVMASRYEGFPLAHGEALACGLPVIASDCPSAPARASQSAQPGGVRELIRRATDGVLTPCEDPAALARAMAALMRDPAVRRQFARNAPAAAARFTPALIVDAWEAVLHQTARPRAAWAG